MNGVKLQVKGLEQIRKRLKHIPAHISAEVDAELSAVANNFEDRAVADAPVDQGGLKSQISVKKLGMMRYEVVSAAEHSAYVEFGTRTSVRIPPGLQAYAAQFKGMKGRGEAKQAIYEWCRRVGIPEEAWYAVFIKLMTKGVEPHPYFFKQLPEAQREIETHAQKAVDRAIKK